MGKKQVITWKTPAAINYGDVLGPKQLNAELSEGDGKLIYEPKAGDKPDAGKVTLQVTATKTKEYDKAEAEVDLLVKKAAQQIVWRKPEPIVHGEALGKDQLNATLKAGDGKLKYEPGSGDKLEVGKHKLKVTAAATTNHEEAEAEVELVVTKARQVIEWKPPADIVYGEALDATQLDAKLKSGDGKLVYEPKSGTKLGAGKHKLKVTASGTKSCEEAELEVPLLVKKAKQVIEWDTPEPLTYGDLLSAKQLDARLKVGDGKLVYASKIGAKGPAGEFMLKVEATATDNYEAQTAEVKLVVKRAQPEVNCTLPARFAHGDSDTVLKYFAGVRIESKPVITPSRYVANIESLVPGTHKFTITAPQSANYEAYTRDCEFIVDPPPPITVHKWMTKLGFQKKGSLYLMDLGMFPGFGSTHTGNDKKHHLTIFTSGISTDPVPWWTAADVMDNLFPSNGDKGFHVTLEWQVGVTSLKNPHVYRDVDEIYKGQGITFIAQEWEQLRKKLSTILAAHVKTLRQDIANTGWCKP